VLKFDESLRAGEASMLSSMISSTLSSLPFSLSAFFFLRACSVDLSEFTRL
jgi:hypothetical protein